MKTVISICLGLVSSAMAQDKVVTFAQQHKEWVDMLETDQSTLGLKHWRQVSCPKSTFTMAKDEDGNPMIKCTGKPFGLLRSAKVYENFMFEMDWRHMTRQGMKANSGLFLWSDALPSVGIPFARSIEVQVANFHKNTSSFTRHGDIFSIHGSKMTPDPRFAANKNNTRSLPVEYRTGDTGEWNTYRLLCINGVIQLEVNGRLVAGGYNVTPRKGHVTLESEGGEVHFRNIRILPLKSTIPLREGETAGVLDADVSVNPLYSGIDLADWKASKEEVFKVKGWQLHAAAGEGTLKRKVSATKENFKLQADFVAGGELVKFPFSTSLGKLQFSGSLRKGKHRVIITIQGGKASATLDGETVPFEVAHPIKKEIEVVLAADNENTINFSNLFLIE